MGRDWSLDAKYLADLDRFCISFEDISDRYRFKRLRRYQTLLLDSLHHTAFDASHVIRTWNRAAEDLLGWSAAEAIGAPAENIIAFEGGMPREEVHALFAEGKPAKSESRMRRKSGEWVEKYSATAPSSDT